VGPVSQRPAPLALDAGGLASFFRALITPRAIRPQVPVGHVELATLTQPALLIWGNEDVFLNPEVAEPSNNAIPDATVTRVTGGHMPWLNEPETCAKALSEFLNA
jgi:pimeloyl-ACP methyl ester carboxylesterase